jgi:hypothetical protein
LSLRVRMRANGAIRRCCAGLGPSGREVPRHRHLPMSPFDLTSITPSVPVMRLLRSGLPSRDGANARVTESHATRAAQRQSGLAGNEMRRIAESSRAGSCSEAQSNEAALGELRRALFNEELGPSRSGSGSTCIRSIQGTFSTHSQKMNGTFLQRADSRFSKRTPPECRINYWTIDYQSLYNIRLLCLVGG